MEYQKRSGTSGISGQFYETKLLGLVLFRLLHDERVKDFLLATNMDDVGAFDDICLKIKLVGHDRPVAIFLQLKHKDSEEAYLTLDNKTDLIKYINSISTIKRKITSQKDCSDFFKADIAETDCLLILYTNARFKLTNSVLGRDDYTAFVSSYASALNDLLNTSRIVGPQQFYSDQHVKDFGEIILEEDLKILAEHFLTFLIDKANQSMNIMNDEYIQQYHVILKQRVVDVSDIHTQEPDSKWRYLTFRQDFFYSEDRYLAIFRDILFKEVIKKLSKLRNNNEAQKIPRDLTTADLTIDKLISSFLSEQSAITLSPLIGTYIACDEDGKLEFLIHRANYTDKLRQVNISLQTIGEAFLRSLKLKVPITFGNVDLVISGNPKKTEKRLNHLVTAIVGLCQQYQQETSYKVVTIDDALDGGLLGSNGGLASAVGNLLVYDDVTKMMKFSTDFTSLPNNAKMLFEKLTKKTELIRDGIDNMHVYRFDIKTKKFPKLHLDCTVKVKAFLSKLVVYEKQKNHCSIEELLKHVMQERLNIQPNLSSINAHSVFLHYHNEILKWWMSSRTGQYLTKANNLYEQAVNDIKAEPQISALNTTFYINNSRYFTYSFNEDVTKWMELTELPSKMFIVTDTVILTTVKVIQCLRNYYSIDKYAVLDTEWVFKLPAAEFILLDEELRKTSKVLIIVFHNVHNKSDVDSILSKLAQATERKNIVFITNSAFIKVLNKYFSNTITDFYEDQTQSLNALTAKSRKEIIKNAKVTFQAQELGLDLILDDESISLIKGVVLDKIIHNNVIHLGTSLSNSSYEDIKQLYIDRRVSPFNAPEHDTYDDVHLVRTFHDIEDDVVLLTATPGMGKSTLLTHLSLQVKEYDVKLFIVRVNFLDHSKQFYKWNQEETTINDAESLKFLCQVALRNKNISFTIKISDEEAHLVSCTGDEQVIFELNIFLHFYNRRRLIFVFDGFDEICPHYKDKVINFLDVAKNQLQKNKMWVTSRPYSDILPDLLRVFGRCYKLECFSLSEQELYLECFWREKRVYEQLSDELNRKFKNFLYIRTYLCQISNVIEENELNRLLQYRDQFRVAKVDNLSGSPLLLYFIADYFLYSVILENNPSKLDSGFNICDIYEMFIENKLKKILFEHKNKMDLYNPYIILKFEKERDECITVHKILAAYAILKDPVFRTLEFEELIGMDPLNEVAALELNSLLTKIKEGADKIGLISHVTADNIPVFIHRTFTEYFAAGYVCDILKSDKFTLHQKTLFYYSTLVCCQHGVSNWIYIIQEKDEDLRRIIRKIESKELHPLWDKPNPRWYFVHRILSKGQFVRLLSSSAKDYDDGCLDKYHFQLMILRNNVDNDCITFIKELYSDISSKMKPHLKKYFVKCLNPEDNQKDEVKEVE